LSSSQHTFRNIGERWNLARGNGSREFDALIKECESEHGKNPDIWPKFLAYKIIFGASEERAAAGRLTGDWIIFAKYNGDNYYLDLSSHEEGLDADRLALKLKNGNIMEFPFLFEGG
jgi:hypothetical protein